LVDDPGILIPLAQVDFLFRDTPIKTVLESIEQAYGIDITFNEHKFSGCSLDADLNKLTLHGKLKAICDKVAGSYEIIDARIVMQGGNCEHEFAQVVTGL
jgi:transmembrane sensor